MNRRSFLTNAPAALVLPATAAAGLPFGQQILHHATEINRLLRATIPEDATLTGVQWSARNGGTPDLWASHITSGLRLFHFRPQFRDEWREHRSLV